MTPEDLCFTSATDLAALIRGKAISPVEVIDAFLARIDTVNAGRAIHSISWLGFTYPFNLTGHLAASIPCGWTAEGLPVGLQFVGRRFADALVLQASAAFEEARPWAHRRPALGE
jgi:Asp-tRNA(Asn)/Glu-tRNA(Gln) amidotransferase A subunit family amidase